MEMIIAILLAIIFGLLGGIHAYWAFGGRSGLAAAIPSVDGKPTIQPGPGATLVVAGGLFALAAMAIGLVHWPLTPKATPPLAVIWVARGMAGLFFIRAVGDFRYVGFTKRHFDSPFARRDTRLYSPLCLLLGAGLLFLTL